MSFWKINTEEERQLLINNYSKLSMNELLKLFPGRQSKHIYVMASNLGLERECKRFGKIDKLFEDTPEIYYWIGFLFADGNFKNSKLVRLSIVDKDHLTKLARLLEIKNIRTIFRKGNYNFPDGSIAKDRYIYEISLQDVKKVPLLTQKFDISTTKTKNPPKLDVLKNMSDDLFISFFCGYVDGDGSIFKTNSGKNCYAIQLCCHSSWLEIYKYIEGRINNIFDRKPYLGQELTKIKKPNYSYMKICDNYLLGRIKKKAIELKLPLMERKWNLIDENYLGAHQVASQNKEKIIPLYKQGLRKCEIAKQLSLPWFTVRNTIKSFNEKELS